MGASREKSSKLVDSKLLRSLRQESLAKLAPAHLFNSEDIKSDEALLCWGKAALSGWRALRGSRAVASLVVQAEAPGQDIDKDRGAWLVHGEHPLPGPGSFEAGRHIVEFFNYLDRIKASRLRIFLSGGASSSAWLPPAGITQTELGRRLGSLYAHGLDIRELNRRRSSLCALKAGGAARLLRWLAPEVRARVDLISDVAPFGSEVVGSGPFLGLPHRVLADNSTWVRLLARLGAAAGLKILDMRSGELGDWKSWVSSVVRAIHRADGPGLILLGGEPSVRLPVNGAGAGGRLSQIALALALRFQREIAEGKIEVLACASDGMDGKSGSSGVALLGRDVRAALTRKSWAAQAERSLQRFNTSGLLRKMGALLPSEPACTNVQDVLLVRLLSPLRPDD